MKKVVYLEKDTHILLKTLSAKAGLNMKQYIVKILKEKEEQQ